MEIIRIKKAFTLGEVLVTVLVIGFIASLTIPSLIHVTQQQDMKSAFKKSISTLNRAIELSMVQESADTNTCNNCNSNATALALYFINKLNVITQVTNIDTPYFYTTDGMKYTVINATGACDSANVDPVSANCLILVDVNGDKTPNIESTGYVTFKDQYRLVVRKNSVIPASNSEYQVAMNALQQ